ncbi:MAG: hypothetical protein HRU22_05670 [Gammaproteobacteria bacterium]|nr:hypothetical protein [Gammaproteobacteria bacterium]
MTKNKTRFFTALLISIITIICVIYLIAPNQSQPINHSIMVEHPTDQVSDNTTETFITPSQEHKTDLIEDTDNYQYCERLIKADFSDGYSWASDQYKSWERYLNQGYTLDEVTLVVEHFLNSNFAAEFRVEQLRLHSDLSNQNQQLNEELQRLLSQEQISGLKLEVVRALPAAGLIGYVSLTPSKKVTLLQQVTPSVDDIAYFIGQSEYSDLDIIELLNSVIKPDAIVGYDKFEAISLLDYAVISARVTVVEKLLQLGLKPSEDSYLGSTMEWALRELSRSTTPERRNASAKIVISLNNLGAKARFKTRSQSKIYGIFPRNSFSFNAKEIEGLIADYGLELTLIESRYNLFESKDNLLIDKGNELLVQLTHQQAEYLSKRLNIDNLKQQVTSCKLTVDTINRAWQPESSKKILRRVIAKHPQSPHQIELTLAAIEPSLVDCYLITSDSDRRQEQYLSDVDDLFQPLKNGKVLDVIDQFLSLNLTDQNKNWAFFEILMWDLSFYDELINSGLMVDELQYYSFNSRMLSPKSLDKLAQSGADLNGVDSRGKTLLYYAVHQSNLALLGYMTEKQFPFSLNDQGQDPLHAALDIIHYEFSPDKLVATVDILMGYSPLIDQFHLSRMALLKLKYVDVYRQVTAKYPQLKVQPETTLPKTLCGKSYLGYP